MFKKNQVIFLFLVFCLLPTGFIRAVCPLCTIAVGAGVGLCRYLGINDLISGVWIGGLMISMILWLLDWLDKKIIQFPFRWLIISILFYLVLIIPLYLTGIIGHPFNKFLGIDRLLFGIISGSLIFLISVGFNNFLKKKNQGKVFFPFQKVIIPIIFLLFISLTFYFTC